MLGSKGCERMPLVSSCEISTENRIELFKNFWFSPEISKKDDFKNYIVLIEKVPHGMGINNVSIFKNTMCRTSMLPILSFLNL